LDVWIQPRKGLGKRTANFLHNPYRFEYRRKLFSNFLPRGEAKMFKTGYEVASKEPVHRKPAVRSALAKKAAQPIAQSLAARFFVAVCVIVALQGLPHMPHDIAADVFEILAHALWYVLA
jgi:hypothetical protein